MIGYERYVEHMNGYNMHFKSYDTYIIITITHLNAREILP